MRASIMTPLGIAIAVAVFAHAITIADGATIERDRRRMKIGLFTASFPWTFGPYQSQMHRLSLLLSDLKDDDDIEYDIYWLNHGDAIPEGVYKTYEELKPQIPKTVPPPKGFPLDHITFLGPTQTGQLSASLLNKIQKQFGLDCFLTLLDITKVVPDEALNIPVVAWVPLHSERVSPATPDYWVLRMYHGIAGLSPSAAKAIDDAVGKASVLTGGSEADVYTTSLLQGIFGSVEVDFIPHIFDREAISASADIGLDMLKDRSVAEADAELAKKPLVNRGQESTLEAGHSNSLFGEERKDDFVVLLQGGNYDSQDRKGWDTSLQAFVRFYNSLDDPSGVHLLIHSMESYLISADSNLDMDAPASVMPMGNQLRFLLHEHGLPKDAYTIDIAKHVPEVVAAYKKRSDVCLHPSKVEGFGMNVMECQVVGTPVITTNHTAMADFTKLGRSVPHRQTIRNPGFIYDMAMPDVIGVADALGEIYEEHLAIKRGDQAALVRREGEVTRFNEWIDTTCSPAVVGHKFKSLLLRSYLEFSNRNMAKQNLFSVNPPTYGAYETASGYHTNIVDWDAPYTLLAPDGLKITDPQRLNLVAWQTLLRQGLGSPPLIFVIPAKYEDGTNVPVVDDGGIIHEDLPVLVRTVLVTSMQGQMSRRKSIVMSIFHNTGYAPSRLPDGLAIIERNNDSDVAYSRKIQNGEL